MRFTVPAQTMVGLVALIGLNPISAATAAAQSPVSTLEELRRELTPGDVVTVVDNAGEEVAGRLVRFGDRDLELVVQPRTNRAKSRQPLTIAIPLANLRSLDRPRDPSKDGALTGMAIGGGAVLALSLYALAVDRNEADEWGPTYLGVGGVFAGIGAITGWAIDRAHSKRHIRFSAVLNGARRSRGPINSRTTAIAVTFRH